jgi:hypothetical protein
MAVLRLTQHTGTGAIATGDVDVTLVLTPAAAVAACDIKEGGTGGTVVLSVQAAANGGSVQVGPFRIKDPFISALTGAGAKLSVAR